MWRLAFVFVVLLPMIMLIVGYIMYRAGVFRRQPRESKRLRQLREQAEENEILDRLMQQHSPTSPPLRRIRRRDDDRP